MDTPTKSRSGRVLVALLVSSAMVVVGPVATAAPTGNPSVPHAHQPPPKHKSKVAVHAQLGKNHVRAGEKVKIQGRLDVVGPPGRTLQTSAAPSGPLEPIIVQKLQAGVWVDIATTWCNPGGHFGTHLSFDLSAQLTLRVYHPETELYTAASSGIYTLLVG